jgi:hypothetical protein
MMTKPGIATEANKGMYEIAAANGLNPMSVGNPFPTDRLFASYEYGNILGPVVAGEGISLWGFSPSSPVIDVMDQLGGGITPAGLANGKGEASIGGNLLGMATPFAKIPLDLATQQSNGVPIKDPAQYLQDSLTGSYGQLLSKSTGKLITGQGRTDSANAANGNASQGQIAAQQLANFLTGLKITNYQSPSSMRAVRGEMKSNVSANKAQARRNM